MVTDGKEALPAFECQRIIRQVVQLLVIEWEFWHEGTGRNGLRIFEVLDMPIPIWSAIGDIGKIGRDIGSLPMNAVTGETFELLHQGNASCKGGILLGNRVEIFERNSQQRKHDD